MYTPWRRIKSWRCLACGKCCRHFSVPLRAIEYVQITNNFGDGVVTIDTGKPRLKKVGGTCVFQHPSGLCELQSLGLKPSACKLWPFAILDKKHTDAVFHFKGKKYYVYVNTSCMGINKGDPSELPLTVHEVIEISLNPDRPQACSTSNVPSLYSRFAMSMANGTRLSTYKIS